MEKKIGIDKRKYFRVDFKRPIKVHGKGVDLFQAHLAKDLSQGGIRVNSPEFIAVNSSVVVQIKLTDVGRVFDLEGKVAWVRQLPHTDGFQLGLEFTGGPSFAKWQIANFTNQKK